MTSKKPEKPKSPMKSENLGTQAKAGLGRDVQTKIGQQLRAMYDDVVQEGVPHRFAELLRQLEKPSDEGKS